MRMHSVLQCEDALGFNVVVGVQKVSRRHWGFNMCEDALGIDY